MKKVAVLHEIKSSCERLIAVDTDLLVKVAEVAQAIMFFVVREIVAVLLVIVVRGIEGRGSSSLTNDLVEPLKKSHHV